MIVDFKKQQQKNQENFCFLKSSASIYATQFLCVCMIERERERQRDRGASKSMP